MLGARRNTGIFTSHEQGYSEEHREHMLQMLSIKGVIPQTQQNTLKQVT
jgi:hypothetical protein